MSRLSMAMVLLIAVPCSSRPAMAQSTELKSSSMVADAPVHYEQQKVKLTAGELEESKYELLPGVDPENRLGFPLMKHLADDQRAFWTTPAHFRVKDLKWIAPFAGSERLATREKAHSYRRQIIGSTLAARRAGT